MIPTWKQEKTRRNNHRVDCCTQEWRALLQRAASPTDPGGGMNQLYRDYVYYQSCTRQIVKKYPRDVVERAAGRLKLDIDLDSYY